MEASLAAAGPVVGVLAEALHIGLRDKGAGEAEATALRGEYIFVLGDLPYFAVELACLDFRFGRAGDGRWVPTPPEIRRRAEYHAQPVRDELGGILKILEFSKTAKVADVIPSAFNVADVIKQVVAKMQPRFGAGEAVDTSPEPKDEAKARGARGGHARAKSLTPEDRSDIARKAAQARWTKVGRPLDIETREDKAARFCAMTADISDELREKLESAR